MKKTDKNTAGRGILEQEQRRQRKRDRERKGKNFMPVQENY